MADTPGTAWPSYIGIRAPMPDAFWRHVTRDGANGCWEWQGFLTHDGYGRFNLRGHIRFAHRVAYELVKGAIPDGLQLDHLCRNRGCVNPAHLEPVTSPENVRRSPIAPSTVNAAKTHCVRGHEYTPENTHVVHHRTSAAGYDERRCRACDRVPTLRSTNPECHYGDHDWSGATCSRCGFVNGPLLSYFRFEKAEREGRAHGDHFHRTIAAKERCTRSETAVPRSET